MSTILEGEIRYFHEKGCKHLVAGTGQSCLAILSTNAAAYLEAKGRKVTAQPIPKAIQACNAAKKGTLGLFHVTC